MCLKTDWTLVEQFEHSLWIYFKNIRTRIEHYLNTSWKRCENQWKLLGHYSKRFENHLANMWNICWAGASPKTQKNVWKQRAPTAHNDQRIRITYAGLDVQSAKFRCHWAQAAASCGKCSCVVRTCLVADRGRGDSHVDWQMSGRKTWTRGYRLGKTWAIHDKEWQVDEPKNIVAHLLWASLWHVFSVCFPMAMYTCEIWL